MRRQSRRAGAGCRTLATPAIDAARADEAVPADGRRRHRARSRSRLPHHVAGLVLLRLESPRGRDCFVQPMTRLSLLCVAAVLLVPTLARGETKIEVPLFEGGAGEDFFLLCAPE